MLDFDRPEHVRTLLEKLPFIPVTVLCRLLFKINIKLACEPDSLMILSVRNINFLNVQFLGLSYLFIVFPISDSEILG
jgi:hypothetical protein